jgi:ADP-ribose pyrophosphatase YjhB (NUDIX family)
MPPRIPLAFISAYWRLTRGATLGAQGVVIDNDDRVLLVQHGYQPGWHFPGGGIEWRETAETALARELLEEAGVVMQGRPRLHGLFANLTKLPSDHIALFIVRDWERPNIPASSFEIRESRFFPRDALPEDTTNGTKRRLAEIFGGAPIEPHW